MTRLAVLTSHPIQYYAPLFRELAGRVDLHVYFAHRPTAQQQAEAGFGTAFEWDIDLLDGYSHSFLRNVARVPDATRFSGCDTPDIRRHLAQGRFDAVLSLGWHLKSLLQGIIAAKRLGLPVMIRGDSQHGLSHSLPKTVVKAALYPALLRVFDAALYVGARNYDYYRAYGYPSRRLFRSPHAVDTAWFGARSGADVRAQHRAALGIADDPIVLFAGKLLPFKRPLDAVATIAALRRQGVPARMMIAGSGPLQADVAAAAKAAAVPLIDLGFCNQSRMPAVYAAADVLLLPSDRAETWGLVCNEALACGTPVVVSDGCGSAPDVTAGGRAGRDYRCGDIDAAAKAIASLLRDRPSHATIAAVSDTFSLASAADGVLAALAAVRRV